MAASQTIVVSAAADGKRLDRLLADELELSRSYVRRLLSWNRVGINGKTVAKGTNLREGDRIEIAEFRHPREGPRTNKSLPIDILNETEEWIAVDKPAGIPTHPLNFEETDTVLNSVLHRFPEIHGVGDGGIESGVLHRLDIGTSGVLLFAKTRDAWERGRAAFSEHRVEKTYFARVHGRLESQGRIRFAFEPRGDHMRRVEKGGREAITDLEVIEMIGDSTLVRARPITGLMHQIRATLAELGHPVIGDRIYGSEQDLDRHWLHAATIQLLGFEASSPVPTYFSQPLA